MVFYQLVCHLSLAPRQTWGSHNPPPPPHHRFPKDIWEKRKRDSNKEGIIFGLTQTAYFRITTETDRSSFQKYVCKMSNLEAVMHIQNMSTLSTSLIIVDCNSCTFASNGKIQVILVMLFSVHHDYNLYFLAKDCMSDGESWQFCICCHCGCSFLGNVGTYCNKRS